MPVAAADADGCFNLVLTASSAPAEAAEVLRFNHLVQTAIMTITWTQPRGMCVDP